MATPRTRSVLRRNKQPDSSTGSGASGDARTGASPSTPPARTRGIKLDQTTIAMVVALTIGLWVGLSFFVAYAGGLHAPKPHRAPFAVIGPEPEASQVAAQLAKAGSALKLRTVPDSATAIEQIKKRSIYGAFEPGAPPHLYVASAGSAVAAQIIEQAGTAIAASNHRRLVTQDIVPLPARDPEGLISFYLVAAAVIAGYIVAVMAATASGATRFSLRRAVRRLALFVGFAIVVSALLMVIADPVMNALIGHYWALVAFLTLVVATSSAVTLGLMAALGQLPGFLAAITLLILLGNSSSGGASPRQFMPGFWRALNTVLPNGAAVNGAVNIAYFPDASLTTPLLVLAAWFVGGSLVFLMLRPRAAATAEPLHEADATASA